MLLVRSYAWHKHVVIACHTHMSAIPELRTVPLLEPIDQHPKAELFYSLRLHLICPYMLSHPNVKRQHRCKLVQDNSCVIKQTAEQRVRGTTEEHGKMLTLAANSLATVKKNMLATSQSLFKTTSMFPAWLDCEWMAKVIVHTAQ